MTESIKDNSNVQTNAALPVSDIDQEIDKSEIITFGQKRNGNFRRSMILSLDLTCRYLKYSLFARRGKATRWLEAGELPEILLQEQKIDKAVAEGLEILSKNINLDKTKILIIIEGAGFFLRRITIPEMKKDSFNEALRWKCAKQIPYPIEEAYLNILDVATSDGQTRVLLAVAKKDQVNRFAFLGDKLLGVVPSPLALSGNFLDQSRQEQTIDILLHWGESEAVIDFINTGRFEFSNSFRFDRITGESPLELLNLAEKIENNLKNSLDFYQSVYSGQQANRIRVHGEGWEEIARRITPIVDIEVACDNPFDSLVEDKEALKRFWDNKECKYLLNAGAPGLDTKYLYLPSSVKKLQKIAKIKSLASLFSAFLIIVVILFGGMFAIEKMNRLEKIETIDNQISQIESSAAFTEARRLENAVAEAAISISHLRPPQKWVAEFMRAISQSVSSGVYFKTLRLSKSDVGKGGIDIRIEGYYNGDLKNADIQLAGLVENLSQYCGFSEDKFERLGERIDGSNKHVGFAITGSARIGQWTAE
ncbi:MAG: hypothetical protein GY839_21960 [candidate division Zixibacteria bacterium]|nr:hypothetical protein [candidate division Zixibacteria bacterium]